MRNQSSLTLHDIEQRTLDLVAQADHGVADPGAAQLSSVRRSSQPVGLALAVGCGLWMQLTPDHRFSESLGGGYMGRPWRGGPALGDDVIILAMQDQPFCRMQLVEVCIFPLEEDLGLISAMIDDLVGLV